MAQELPARDLQAVWEQTRPLWEDVRSKRIFVTGGTGFFGRWLLETFAWANREGGLGAEMVVLTRDVEKFTLAAPHLARNRAIQFHSGDVRDFEFPSGAFDFVVHAATEATQRGGDAQDALRMLAITAEGTRRVLEMARACGAKRFLLTSSGAVNGRQPAGMAQIDEAYLGAPDALDPAGAYGAGKRYAETLCALTGAAGGFEAVIARCWAFVGPGLPLDGPYAAGNFIRDGLAGGPIRVGGDGTALRSYLYASDLAVWLWTLLLRGQGGRAYNVGAGDAVSIAELAGAVARCFDPAPAVEIARAAIPGVAPERYVPSVARIEQELALRPTVDLDEALRRTVAWYQHDKQE